MSRHDEFRWKGSLFRWKAEAWPRFSNAHEKVRDFFGEVSPVGTAWQATLMVGDMKHTGAVTNGDPADALTACHRAMVERLTDALGKVKP